MNPYLGGILIGWILYKTREAKRQTNACCTWLYWLLAAAVFCISILFTSYRNIPAVYCAIILSIGKFAFGLFVGSMVLMCAWGNGGRLNALFSHWIYQHYSKLTYSIYMLSPLVITLVHSTKEVSTHFDEMQTVSVQIFSSIVFIVFIIETN